MNEHEVQNSIDAAFFVANEVMNEYHSFPVVNRADIGNSNCLFVQLNGEWYKFDVTHVMKPETIDRLNALV